MRGGVTADDVKASTNSLNTCRWTNFAVEEGTPVRHTLSGCGLTVSTIYYLYAYAENTAIDNLAAVTGRLTHEGIAVTTPAVSNSFDVNPTLTVSQISYDVLAVTFNASHPGKTWGKLLSATDWCVYLANTTTQLAMHVRSFHVYIRVNLHIHTHFRQGGHGNGLQDDS